MNHIRQRKAANPFGSCRFFMEFFVYRPVPQKNRAMTPGPVWAPMMGPMWKMVTSASGCRSKTVVFRNSASERQSPCQMNT